jgi:hypothetical protein
MGNNQEKEKREGHGLPFLEIKSLVYIDFFPA